MTWDIIQGDCVDVMATMQDNSVDLTVTSPPYDNLRTYQGYTFDYQKTLDQLYRITKQGGVVVWIVNDATINGSETGTSFRQALYAKDIGFNLHDTMIWNKCGFSAVGALATRYAPVFEFMFVLSKGKVNTFNPIIDKPNIHAGSKKSGTLRQSDGTRTCRSSIGKINREFGQRYSIWSINHHVQSGEQCHPAPFPIRLAQDHIISWSNEGDTVLDCFSGSGTTGVACIRTNRNFIGIEISEQYCEMARKRITAEQDKFALLNTAA